MTRIKITNPDDARNPALLGAAAIGLNFYKRSPSCIDSARACRIIERLPAFVSVIGAFVNHLDPQGLEDLALSYIRHMLLWDSL